MPDPRPENTAGQNEIIAQLSREFSQGLPARVQRMQAALGGLTQGYESKQAEEFYLGAHSLKGTAAAYGAHELVDHATNLADMGHRWLNSGAVVPAEVPVAVEELERLSWAVGRYRVRVEGGKPR